ncbi:aldolase [Persephonella atlantica]|uniref:Aldolase n=1 Tax=Persephonella atlantica TaxID=2699429 RepID=A0ABS1GEY9_9AQUI|nr:class II aldolase/adducin family protein [Persephonella atlantica]MBK3331495.1 aldolase [Persephonella atlantica]
MEKIIKEIIFTGKVLYAEGLVNSHAGNISVRQGSSIFITKTGAMLGYLTEEDIVKVPIYETSDMDRLASSELIVHRAIYQSTDYKAIIHAHPINAVALSFSLDREFTPIDNEGRLFLGTVPVIEVNNPSGSPELAKTLSSFFKTTEKNVVIVKKHGSFVAHNSLNYALKLTSDLEFCAKVYNLVNYGKSDN